MKKRYTLKPWKLKGLRGARPQKGARPLKGATGTKGLKAKKF